MNLKLQAKISFVCRHKYIITSAFFVVIIGFVGDSSVLQRVMNQWKLVTLGSQISKYQIQYNNDTRKLNQLNSNPRTIEKIARERYFMKDSLEDIYVFEDDMKKQQQENNQE